MVKNTIIALLTIGVLVLAGCGTSGEKVDSADGLVGIWQRVGGGSEQYCRFSGDGTLLCAVFLDELVTGNEVDVSHNEYWFEGTRYFERSMEDSEDIFARVGVECTEAGEYEIYVQSSGNHRYELIEDECQERIAGLAGLGIYEGEIEWVRVQ